MKLSNREKVRWCYPRAVLVKRRGKYSIVTPKLDGEKGRQRIALSSLQKKRAEAWREAWNKLRGKLPIADLLR